MKLTEDEMKQMCISICKKVGVEPTESRLKDCLHVQRILNEKINDTKIKKITLDEKERMIKKTEAWYNSIGSEQYILINGEKFFYKVSPVNDIMNSDPFTIVTALNGKFIIGSEFGRLPKRWQLAYFLHEVGHIKLGHLEKSRSVNLFGEFANLDYEIQADEYAVKHGIKPKDLATALTFNNKYDKCTKINKGFIGKLYNKIEAEERKSLLVRIKELRKMSNYYYKSEVYEKRSE